LENLRKGTRITIGESAEISQFTASKAPSHKKTKRKNGKNVGGSLKKVVAYFFSPSFELGPCSSRKTGRAVEVHFTNGRQKPSTKKTKKAQSSRRNLQRAGTTLYLGNVNGSELNESSPKAKTRQAGIQKPGD